MSSIYRICNVTNTFHCSPAHNQQTKHTSISETTHSKQDTTYAPGYFPRHAYCKIGVAKETFEPTNHWLGNKKVQAPARVRT